MGLSELLWACRRRWRLIVVAAALAMAAAWLTTPAHANPPDTKPKYTYHATAVMIPATSGVSLDRLSFLATTGDVPNAVRLQFGAKAGGDVAVKPGTG